MTEREGWKKIAYFDFDEVHLSWEQEETGEVEGIPWPEDWPEVVTAGFLRENGFEVI